jgi:hypothetical protein
MKLSFIMLKLIPFIVGISFIIMAFIPQTYVDQKIGDFIQMYLGISFGLIFIWMSFIKLDK